MVRWTMCTYISEWRKNLFSEEILTGMRLLSHENETVLNMYRNENEFLVCAIREPNNLHRMLVWTVVSEINLSEDNLKVCYRRLGHVNNTWPRRLESKELVRQQDMIL